jgi:hypothetical protein
LWVIDEVIDTGANGQDLQLLTGVAIEDDNLSTSATDKQPLALFVECNSYVLFAKGDKSVCNLLIAKAIDHDDVICSFVIEVDVRAIVIEGHGLERIAVDLHFSLLGIGACIDDLNIE